MSKLGEIHMVISEMLQDGLPDEEIARIVALDFDVDEDFAMNLVEDIAEEVDDGQPSSYEEYQDLPWGGDDWDHGQYDEF